MSREDRNPSERDEAPSPERTRATDSIDRQSYLRFVGAAGAFAAGTPGVTGAEPGRSHDARDREVLVGVTDGVSDPATRVREYAPAIADIVRSNETLGYAAVRFPETESAARETFVESVVRKHDVRYAEHNGTAELAFTPDDPNYGDQHVPPGRGSVDGLGHHAGRC